MVFAILSSMRTLICSVGILFFVMYFFALIFTYGALEARSYLKPALKSDLDEYWGSFSRAIYSCFLSVSTGQSWHIIVKPLASYSTYLFLGFLVFIALTVLGVLNVMTSVFVESAIMGAQHYRDLIVQDKEHEKEIAVQHMRQVFNQIDEDNSGEINCYEMERFLKEDSLRKYLEALNVSAEDTRMLFRLLDKDGSDRIDIDEFCDGCMRLKGQARSFDIHVMIYQIRHF